MSKPTPGEWTYDPLVGVVFSDEAEDEICSLPLLSQNADSDGRLLAAAPDLLAALKNLLQNGCTCALNEPKQGLCEACAQAREAIANAEGRR